jgi:formylglycine-generating enzyme required for sulfatase activity
MKKWILTGLAGLCFAVGAETVTRGSVSLDLDFVTIGSPGNPDHFSGFGGVDSVYEIGTCEVTADQWKTVAAADKKIIAPKAPEWAGSEPAASMSWTAAAMFCNWLTSGDAYEGAYHMDEFGTLMAIDREVALATYKTVYVIPTEDEWVKAAYYNGFDYSTFANGLDIVSPKTDENRSRSERVWAVGSGAPEQNGTCDMGGNLAEWTESAFDGSLDRSAMRATRDSAYRFGTISSIAVRTAKDVNSFTSSAYGFRVVKLSK